MDTTIRVETITYQAAHGHLPRQSKQYKRSRWAFQIDLQPEPVFITASYTDAVQQAKAMAQYSIVVLP